MPSDLWMGVLLALTIVMVLAALVQFGFLALRLRRPQDRSFVCPLLHQAVDCRAIQDIRTGQWKTVVACSAFPGRGGDVPCHEDCLKVMNLGYALPPPPA